MWTKISLIYSLLHLSDSFKRDALDPESPCGSDVSISTGGGVQFGQTNQSNSGDELINPKLGMKNSLIKTGICSPTGKWLINYYAINELLINEYLFCYLTYTLFDEHTNTLCKWKHFTIYIISLKK